jgi:hypothetical protein
MRGTLNLPEEVAVSDDSDDAITPRHYRRLSPEPVDVIEAWDLGFHLGNAVKYIARAGHKGDVIEDLSKARWYLDRAIARLMIRRSKGESHERKATGQVDLEE